MTTHWAHVTAGYVVVLGTFLAMAVTTALRHRAAKAMLARLDIRAQARAEARR
jgi:hypothetical protein